MNVLSLFDGMSCGQIALNKAGIKYDNYFASEIDKYSIKITQKNYPNTIQLGDITKISFKDGVLSTENNTYDIGKIDLVIGGSPCQDLSFAGGQSGLKEYTLQNYLTSKNSGVTFTGQSYLFWEYLRLMNEINPEHFLLENVKMKSNWKTLISQNLGVQPIEIDSRYFTPQKRKRLYWTNINVDTYNDKNIWLKDVMLNLTDPKLDIKRPTQKRMDYIQRKIDKGWLKKSHCDTTTQYSECLMATMYKQLQEFIWMDESSQLRFFSPLECERLQTVPDDYTKGVSDTQRYRMLGNGWTVDVVAHILKGLII